MLGCQRAWPAGARAEPCRPATAAEFELAVPPMRLGKTLGWTHADCRGREPDIRQVQGEQIAREAADAVPQALTMIAGPS